MNEDALVIMLRSKTVLGRLAHEEVLELLKFLAKLGWKRPADPVAAAPVAPVAAPVATPAPVAPVTASPAPVVAAPVAPVVVAAPVVAAPVAATTEPAMTSV